MRSLLFSNWYKLFAMGCILAGGQLSCSSQASPGSKSIAPARDQEIMNQTTTEIATFGAGCFWCVEAVFQELKGVIKVESGYMGGEKPNPTYREVSTGKSGHAEVARITFDPAVISYQELLEVFWTTHDPTTLNRQGADVGTQYRSDIFYHSDEQRQTAIASRTTFAEPLWEKPIVTEITPASEFYIAENYHQEYYANNPNAGYCRVVIAPKVEKVRAVFQDKLKDQ